MSALYPATGGDVYHANGVSIDYSNASEGYVIITYSHPKHKKVRIKKDGGALMTFDLPSDGPIVFPLSMGDGMYSITVYHLLSGDIYAQACGIDIMADIKEPTRPYLYPNTYCWYTPDSKCVKFADKLCKGMDTSSGKLAAIYSWVIGNIKYDYELAEKVQTERWWLPCPDEVLASGKSICFGFASLLAGLCRSQGIPTRIEVGKVKQPGCKDDGVLHAYNAVYVLSEAVLPDGITVQPMKWFRLDPTLHSLHPISGLAAEWTAQDLLYKFEYRG